MIMEHLWTRSQSTGWQLQAIGSPVNALAASVAAVSSGMVRDGAWNEDVRLAKACHVSFSTSQCGELWRLGSVPRYRIMEKYYYHHHGYSYCEMLQRLASTIP